MLSVYLAHIMSRVLWTQQLNRKALRPESYKRLPGVRVERSRRMPAELCYNLLYTLYLEDFPKMADDIFLFVDIIFVNHTLVGIHFAFFEVSQIVRSKYS